MKQLLTALFVIVFFTTNGLSDARAQGKGKAIGRGLGSAASGAASASAAGSAARNDILRSGDHLSQGKSHTNRIASGAASGVSGLKRPGGAADRMFSTEAGTALTGSAETNQERILRHRMQQAENLRSLSQQNGNESLMETADRMDTNSLANHQRLGVSTPGNQEATVIEGARTAALPKQAKVTKEKRGFWFRSR